MQVEQNRALAEQMMQQISHIPGHHRPAHPAAVQPAEVDDQCRPHARAGGWLQPARRGAGSAHQPERQLPDHADVLSQSAEPRQLQHRGADAAVRREEPAGAWRTFPIATNGSDQQPQILGNLASIERGVGAGHGEPLQRAADHRHLRLGRRHRSGQRRSARSSRS